jgi:hypothetical protein
MDALQAFLSAEINIETTVPLKRLGIELSFKAIDGKTLAKLQERATHYVGKGAKREAQLDEQKFGASLIATSCTTLNFGDAKLLEKYEASDAGDCVQKALLAGEVAKITQAIMEISGFNDMDEMVDDAKN